MDDLKEMAALSFQAINTIPYNVTITFITESLEKQFKPDITREYFIANLDGCTILWSKRMFVLTDFELEKKYGPHYLKSFL